MQDISLLHRQPDSQWIQYIDQKNLDGFYENTVWVFLYSLNNPLVKGKNNEEKEDEQAGSCNLF